VQNNPKIPLLHYEIQKRKIETIWFNFVESNCVV
jgi:hypothetical protein